MNRYSKILGHTSPSDMRDTHAKKLAEKKRQEDKVIADKEYIRNVMDNIKSDWKRELDENAPANSTTGILGGRVIQSAGDADLQVVQTGLTGDGGIDYGADGYSLNSATGNSTHTGVGEYTGVTAWEPTDSAPDPTGVGTRFRALDAFGGLMHSSMELHMKNIPGYKGGVGGTQLDIGKNYVVAGGGHGHIEDPEYGKHDAIYSYTVDELGKPHPSYNNTDGLTNQGHGSAVIFKNGLHWAPLKPIDTSEFDTIKLRARVAATYIRNPADAVQLYYWAGDKPGFQSLAKDNILDNQTVPHDGWRPLYQKPDGTIDTSVSHIIIPNWQDRPNRLDNDAILADYSQKIPEWCRGKNTRFIIYSQGNIYNSWAMTSVRFQRRNNITVGTPLDSPEASSFVRVGQGSADTTPEQRKKKIEDMLKASRLYLMKVLGYADFPGMGATLDSIASSPIGFHKIYDTHAATLSKGERREFFKNVTDRTRGIGKWRDKVKDPGSNLYKSRGDEKYFYKVTSKDSRGMTKTAVSRTPESVAAWEKMKKEQQRQAAKGGTKRSGKYENSSYEYENQNLLDLKEKASRLFDKPVKKNKLFGHLDVSDLKKTSVVSEDAPANSTGGLYCVRGDRPETNDEEKALKDAAEAEEGITDLAFGSDNPHGLGQSYSPDGTIRNHLAHGWGNWGPKDVPTIWWKNAGGHWNWVAYIGNMYDDHPNNGGSPTGGDGWGTNTSWGYGYPGVPYVGGVQAPSGVMPDWLKNNLEDENGDPIPPDKLEAPPGPPPVIFQGGLGDPDYFPGDPQKNKSKEEEEAEDEIKNQLGVGDEGLESIKNQAEQDSEQTDGEDANEDNMMDKLKSHWQAVWEDLTNHDDIKQFGQDLLNLIDETTDHLPAMEYSKDIAQSVLSNEPIDNSSNITQEDIDKFFEGLDFKQVTIRGEEGKDVYNDEHLITGEDGEIRTRTRYPTDENGNEMGLQAMNQEQREQFEQWRTEWETNPDNTTTIVTDEGQQAIDNSWGTANPLGAAGRANVHTYTDENGQERFSYNDHAYHNVVSTDDSELRYDVQGLLSSMVHAVADAIHDRTEAHNTTGELKIPLADTTTQNTGAMSGYPCDEVACIRGDSTRSFDIPLEETSQEFQEWHKEAKEQRQQNESYISEGWESPKHTDVDKDEKKRWFNQKDIHPDYPRKAPPEMVGGWHPDLKRNDKTPIPTKQYIKIKEVDLIKNYRMKDKEIKKFMNTINSINSYLTRNPSALIHAQMRYPKSDPHLAALNYKMDMQLAAADEYIDKQFPENQRLYNKLVKATQRSIKLTDPKTFKNSKSKMTSINKLMRVDYVMNEYDVTDEEVKKKKIKSNKKSAGRFFKRSKKKTKSDILKDKIAVLDKEMKKTIPDL